MTAPISIVEAQGQILAQPAPVLFLDTCALLDVLRVASERKNTPHRIIPAAEQVAAKADSSIPQLWLLGSDLLDVEWCDNVKTVLESASAHIAQVDSSLAKLHAVIRVTSSILTDTRSDDFGFATAAQPPRMGAFELPRRLKEICERILTTVIRISPDDDVLRAANFRCMKRLKPAAIGKGEYPDCLIIETCFSLCRSLRSRGFVERCAFVSSNKTDFFSESNPSQPHEDLARECSEIGLEFAVALDHALSVLYPSK